MVEWTGLEWKGMEWPDKHCNCGCVRPLTLKLGRSHGLEWGFYFVGQYSKNLSTDTFNYD